ncbi:hypothetical protein SLA2020_507240 [Shorea laevis]
MDVASSPNRTSKVNRVSGDGHRNYEGSSSYIQKTVCLHEWWLTEAESEFDGKRLAVAGSVSGGREPVRVFTSAPIVKRYDAFTLETADGVCVVFRGVINKSRTEENGFSSEVFNHFTFGFPYHWEECAQKCLAKEFGTGTESRGIPDFTVPTTGSACSRTASSLSSTPSKHEEVLSEDEQNSDVEVGCSQNMAEEINVAASEGSIVNNCAINMSGSFEENVSEQITVDAKIGSDRHSHVANLSSSERDINEVSISHAGNRKTRGRLGNRRSSQKSNHMVKCSVKAKDQRSTVKVPKPMDQMRLKRSSPCKEIHDVENCLSWGKTRRKINFDIHASPSTQETQERKGNQSIISLESLSHKRSRSGRLILPPLDFWRNQVAVYDVDRRITGIQENGNNVKLSGTRSEPQKRQTKFT